MTGTDDELEPTVTLRDGTSVSAAVAVSVAVSVAGWQALGHTVSVVHGAVVVTPPIDPDALALMDLNWHDVLSILSETDPH